MLWSACELPPLSHVTSSNMHMELSPAVSLVSSEWPHVSLSLSPTCVTDHKQETGSSSQGFEGVRGFPSENRWSCCSSVKSHECLKFSSFYCCYFGLKLFIERVLFLLQHLYIWITYLYCPHCSLTYTQAAIKDGGSADSLYDYYVQSHDSFDTRWSCFSLLE